MALGFVLHLETQVIPAKAGIDSWDSAFLKVCGVDSRFRGNGCDPRHPYLANGAITQGGHKTYH
jgi:hypothetical protein